MPTTTMTKAEAIRFFGKPARVAAALGITRSAVTKWPDVVPELRARQLIDIMKSPEWSDQNAIEEKKGL